MARTVLRFNNPTLKLADTEAGLSTGTAYECQVTSAVVTANPTFQEIPATGCAPATQSPGQTGYQLDVEWLQDWNAPAGGLSGYAFENDGAPKWIEIVPDVADPTTKLTGQVYIVAGNFGGTFGDGSAGVSTATWPFVDKPVVTTPVAAAAARASSK